MTTQSQMKDPVCGMDVDPVTSRKSVYEGFSYFFCSESCLRKFEDDPTGVLEARSEKAAAETPHMSEQH